MPISAVDRRVKKGNPQRHEIDEPGRLIYNPPAPLPDRQDKKNSNNRNF